MMPPHPTRLPHPPLFEIARLPAAASRRQRQPVRARETEESKESKEAERAYRNRLAALRVQAPDTLRARVLRALRAVDDPVRA